MNKQRGFTLTELIITIAIFAMMALLSLSLYQSQVKRARLNKAKSLLLENQHFMTQYYARYLKFKKTSTTWPDLPNTETPYFTIGFTSSAKGEMSGGYRLKAVPKDSYLKTEKRYLVMDHSGNIKLCTIEKDKGKSKTRCQVD